MSPFRSTSAAALGLLCAIAATTAAQVPGRSPIVPRGTRAAAVSSQGELPVKYTGKPTTEAITAGDLMTRLYILLRRQHIVRDRVR